jgi:lysophospholipase L1-like esterase
MLKNVEVKKSTPGCRELLLGFGLIFILAASIYNEFVLVLFDPKRPLDPGTLTNIRHVQLKFLVIGLTFIVAADSVISRVSWLGSFAKKDSATKLLLATLPVLTLLVVLEFSLKPFARTRSELTSIYVRDSELGWKLKPNAEDLYGGLPVRINGKGLRGPELNYIKHPGVKRILFLGDSVTFGYKLKNYEQTFPHLVESLLKTKSGYSVESINSGVGGYSPWQEYIFLAQEGIKYDPDLIVISFVLNDVTEPLGLVKFGGTGEGWQLEHTVSGELEKLFEASSIAYFARRITARLRFGENIQQGAELKQKTTVKEMVLHADRPDIQKAWENTLQHLQKIFDYAKARDIPLLLVVFPFTFQFDDVANLSTPQKILSKYAHDNKVPVIDLLPILARKMAQEGFKPRDYFLDDDHLSAGGSETVAEILANFIQQQGLLADGGVKHEEWRKRTDSGRDRAKFLRIGKLGGLTAWA